MPEDELVPELHDVGKLVDNEALAEATGLPFAHHYFSDRKYQPLNLSSANLPLPSGPTWAAICYHGGRVLGPKTQFSAPPQDVAAHAGTALADVYLTILSDHLAASTSRPVAEEEAREAKKEAGAWPPDISRRHCLWRDQPQHSVARGPLLSTPAELHELLTFVADRPDAPAFYERYGRSLNEIPEEKGFPGGVTTLKTHCDLVGRFYRVLRSVAEPSARGLTYDDDEQQTYGGMEEHWRFRLARCRLRIPAVPARLRDLGVFQRLEAAMGQLELDPDRRDHLLLSTFQDLWLFLPLEAVRSMENVLKPLLDAGFQVEAEAREAPLTNLTAWGNWVRGASEKLQYLQPAPAAEISPPLCDVCQLAQGKFWQKRPDDVAEYLCATCCETREKYSQRFQRLEEWDTDYAAWLRVFLDFDALEEHLRQLFRKYVATRGREIVDAAAQEQLIENLRTTALTVDYVNDFLAMQEDLDGKLRSVFPADDVEALTAKRKELFVVRLDSRRDVFRLLELCHVIASRHFPRSLSEPPFRFAISLGPVRFPFGEHWRLLQEAHDEVTISLVGSGALTCRLDVMPQLLSLAKQAGASGRGLHRLADLAAESPALAKVALADRAERDLAGVAPRLRQLGLDFESMATFARLTKE